MPSYRISGLTVASDLDLPGVSPVAQADGDADVALRVAPVPERLEAATLRRHLWDLDGRRFLLQLDGIGRFLASDGRLLEMEPAPDSSPEDALPFLLGTGFGALLYQRGGLVLHAATVAEGGRAYAFCGRSGIGKSTLAAALCRGGLTAVSDDICAVGLDSRGRAMAWPDGRQLKLLEDAIAHLGLEDRRQAPVRRVIAKHFVDPPGSATDEPTPLAAIYLLRDERLPGEAGITRLGLIDAAQSLLNNSYRPSLALALATSAQVAHTAAMLRHVPVFLLDRPRGLDRLDDTVAELRAHWQSL